MTQARMNTGDLKPDWTVAATAAVGTDLSGVSSWKFKAYTDTENGKVLVITDAAPAHVAGATPNVVAVTHAWVAGETDTAAVLHGVPIAVWPGGKEQSFPGATLEIVSDPT